MALSNTEYGKAYEYACLLSLNRYLTEKGVGPVVITESDAMNTARTAFEKAYVNRAEHDVSGQLSFLCALSTT